MWRTRPFESLPTNTRSFQTSLPRTSRRLPATSAPLVGFFVGFSVRSLTAVVLVADIYSASWEYVAPPGGLEPPTVCLEGSCSIPLSYGGLEGNRQNLRLQA